MPAETEYIKDEISRCEDVTELKEKILPILKSQKDQWTEKINEILSDSGLTKTRFAKLCMVSRVSLDKWLHGAIPRNRESFIRIGMAAGYDRTQIDRLLHRYGRFPALYSKSLEDCVCIYVLNLYKGEDALNQYDRILNTIKTEIMPQSGGQEDMATLRFDEKLSEVRDVNSLETFITDNSAVFAMAYNKLYSYILMNIEVNYSRNVAEMAMVQGWSSSLTQCISAIRQKKWYPTRNKIISIGLHLSMDVDQINEMLELAHMEPLCAKNIFESAIMFILYDAELNDKMNRESDCYDPDDLCRYAKRILEDIDLPEADFFFSEISEIDDE